MMAKARLELPERRLGTVHNRWDLTEAGLGMVQSQVGLGLTAHMTKEEDEGVISL